MKMDDSHEGRLNEPDNQTIEKQVPQMSEPGHHQNQETAQICLLQLPDRMERPEQPPTIHTRPTGMDETTPNEKKGGDMYDHIKP